MNGTVGLKLGGAGGSCERSWWEGWLTVPKCVRGCVQVSCVGGAVCGSCVWGSCMWELCWSVCRGAVWGCWGELCWGKWCGGRAA